MRDIAWFGVRNPANGYGASNLDILESLRNARCKAWRVDDLAESEAANKCEVSIAYAPATSDILSRLPSGYRILWTMFEADRWPGDWVGICNCAHEVWVPSEFCKASLLASGCEAPVRVIPLGVATEAFNADDRPTLRDCEFTFGYHGAAQWRKGYDLVLQAFEEEFGPDEPVRLKIRSSIIAEKVKHPKVHTDAGIISREKLRKWYQDLDCFVFPSRGEGFGLTALEAMACGTCAIITDGGGCADYIADDCLRVAVDGKEPCPDYYNCGGNLVRPSLASLRFCMRWAYEHRLEVAAMGLAAAQRVAENWNYRNIAKRIMAAVKEADTSKRVEVEAYDVVVWHGDPRKVISVVGGFTKGEPVIMKPEHSVLLTDDRFQKERRYRRLPDKEA